MSHRERERETRSPLSETPTDSVNERSSTDSVEKRSSSIPFYSVEREIIVDSFERDREKREAESPIRKRLGIDRSRERKRQGAECPTRVS